MSKAGDRRRQKREAERKKAYKQQRHNERFGQPESPCTIDATVGQAFLYRNGPLLIGSWWLPSASRNALASIGRAVPQQVSGVLLLDTGATNTCISLKAAQTLGLTATRIQDGYGAGGLHRNPVFFATLEISIADEKTGKITTIGWEQEVQGIPDLELHAQGLQYAGESVEVVGLLGRDILRHTRLAYDGIDGRFEITFDLKSLQQQPSR